MKLVVLDLTLYDMGFFGRRKHGGEGNVYPLNRKNLSIETLHTYTLSQNEQFSKKNL